MLRDMVAARKSDGFDGGRLQVTLAGGLENRNRTRELIQELQTAENELMRERTRDQDYRLFVILGANVAALIVGATITIVAWYLVERELGKRRAAEANAHLERQNLWVTLTSIADGVIVSDEKGLVKLGQSRRAATARQSPRIRLDGRCQRSVRLSTKRRETG